MIPSEIFESVKGRGVNSKRTACEVHRGIYDLVIVGVWPQHPELAEEIVGLLEEAFTMNLKMNNKLLELGFNTRFAEGFLPNNDVQKVTELRKKRVELIEKNNMDY